MLIPVKSHSGVSIGQSRDSVETRFGPRHQVSTHYDALAKSRPHLFPWLLHSPICHLAGDGACFTGKWRRCCWQLWV